MDYVIRVSSLRSNKAICEHKIEAASKKEAEKKMIGFITDTKFRDKDISFSLWKKDPESFMFEEI